MDIHIDCEALKNQNDGILLNSIIVCNTEVFVVIWKDMHMNIALVSNFDASQEAAKVYGPSVTDNLAEVDAIVNDLISNFKSQFCFCNKR